MYFLRKVIATVLMLVASFFKILTITVSPKDLKEDFKNAIWSSKRTIKGTVLRWYFPYLYLRISLSTICLPLK